MGEENAKPRAAELIQTTQEVWAAERQRLWEVEEAAHVAYEFLVYQNGGNPPLSQFTIDSVIERLRKALGRERLG